MLHGVDLRAVAQQDPGCINMSGPRHDHERRLVIGIWRLDVRPSLQQPLHQGAVPHDRGLGHRRRAVIVLRVDVRARSKEAFGQIEVVLVDCPVERRRAVRFGRVDIDTLREEGKRSRAIADLTRRRARTAASSKRDVPSITLIIAECRVAELQEEGLMKSFSILHSAILHQFNYTSGNPTAVADLVARNSGAVEQRQQQVRQRRPVGVLQVLTTLQLAASTSHHQRRQREFIMGIAVAHVAAVEQDRVIQHGAVPIWHRRELAEELGKDLTVIRLDLTSRSFLALSFDDETADGRRRTRQ